MANSDGKVPIDESISAAYRFMASSLPVVFPAAAFVAVFTAAGQTLINPALGANAGLGWPLFLLAMLGSVAYSAFVLRLAIREDASGFFGLKFGADELRLLGVGLALLSIFVLILLAFLIIGVSAFAIIASQMGIDFSQISGDEAAAQVAATRVLEGGGGIILLLMAAAMLAALLWLSMRFSLAQPATIGEQRITLLSTFGWTKGNSLRILAAVCVVVFPLAFGIGAISAAVGTVVGLSAGVPEAIAKPSPAGLPAYAVYQFLFALGEFALAIPAQLGLYAFLYKGLRPPTLTP